MLEETRRNLADKAPQAIAAFELLTEVLGASVVTPSNAAVRRAAGVVNLKDAPIVAAAIRARADYLATHDVKTLLRYKDEVLARLGVRLVQPHEVLNLLRRGH